MKFKAKICLSFCACLLLAVSVSVMCGCGSSEQASRLGDLQSPASVSFMVDSEEANREGPEFDTEAYDAIVENDFIVAMNQPQSTFAVDVDTASYANVRRMLHEGQKPPSGAVRIEEMVNYFAYGYPEPDGPHPFSVLANCSPCPWNPEHELLRVALKGKSPDLDNRKPCNLVFLLDVSGSMMQANKLHLVKTAMQMLTENLEEQDHIAIVVYAGASGLVLDSTSVANSDQILEAIESLQAGGSTNGGQGIQLAYRIAERNKIDGGINRVLLCTDGDFNVGMTSESALVDLIEEKAKSNVFLTVLGFGTGNLKDATMEKLADRGNGNYAYIDSELEARKVLVEQVGGTLETIAKDVKIQVDFNPRHVQSYRLLGYENRLMNNQDFRDDSKDAGEIGAGHHVTALYELVPQGAESSPASRSSEFVSRQVSSEGDRATKLTVNLRYKEPEGDAASEFQVRLDADDITREPSADFRFVSAVAAYGMLLRESKYASQADWDWVIETAQASRGEDPRGLREEFVQLAKLARRLDRSE